MGAWPDRNAMLKRMIKSDLFTKQLSGPCLAARESWNILPDESFKWSVAVVNRPAADVRQVIQKWPHIRLLIVNTPKECVIGGELQQVNAAIEKMGCSAFFLDGVVTVHCDAALPVRNDYKNLHVFPVNPVKNVRFYSCAKGKSYALTSDAAAESITQQAMEGFDFAATIMQAYADGVRIFLEMGPQASCTRMIQTILEDKHHLAISACRKSEDNRYTLLKLLGNLIAQRIPINMDALYGPEVYPETIETSFPVDASRVAQVPPPLKKVVVPVGGLQWPDELPNLKRLQIAEPDKAPGLQMETNRVKPYAPMELSQTLAGKPMFTDEDTPAPEFKETMDAISAASEATASAHHDFLEFSSKLTQSMTEALELQARLLEEHLQSFQDKPPSTANQKTADELLPAPAFNRDMCMEFAIGSIEKVLGPDFAIIDTYKARVRLPDEPLMLVDRILSVEGQKRSLGPGKIVTEHDVGPDAWYLDGGRAPVCISVEAGQADLFLCSYLGIDHVVKGERTYRLLDATVAFHRDLPEPGDVLRYEIEIEKFVKQGATHLFFFNFRGFANDTPLLRMTNGCAGFFTEDEVKNSGGIILTPEELAPQTRMKPADWKDLVPQETATYDDQAIEALRHGNLARCFGQDFDDVAISSDLCLPGDRMHLIDRVKKLDPKGGRYSLGIIQAEADILPDDWFLTCHFMDDMVMPGTLMYECCAHTLRVFVQRLGWVTELPGVHYGPVPEIKSILKCRGPVTPETRQVVYEVEVKEIGYRPEPYVIADAHMYADGHRIVMFQDMSLQMWGITRDEIEAFWHSKPSIPKTVPQPVFDTQRLREFCRGKPSVAFGDPYAIYDKNRFIARLPAPPYAFIDRITSIEPPAWVLKPDGWIEAEFDVYPQDWYFAANQAAGMPYCVINEIALQACGWLAAYMGSALRSEKDLRFRNLGGTATIKKEILPEPAKLKTRARLTQVSEAGEMIIEHFEFVVTCNKQTVYAGNTHFGFFTEQALAQQVGVRENVPRKTDFSQNRPGLIEDQLIQPIRPLTPDDPTTDMTTSAAMPSTALCMFDKIETYLPDGSPQSKGYIRGMKKVDPDAWFFKAHFHQDPVCPGSLGLESLLQLLKFDALQRWKNLAPNMRFMPLDGVSHDWMYRGQILPTNREIAVDALITEAGDLANPFLKADGYLHVDGLCIYKMQNFGVRLVPVDGLGD